MERRSAVAFSLKPCRGETAIAAVIENPEQELAAGTKVLDRYHIVGKLTQGGMAEVYLAKQQGPAGYQKLIVVKRVRPQLASDSDFVAMFVNEARLAAMINHPNVVQIFDLGQTGNDWFLAMEYLDGRDLLQIGRACRAMNKAVPFDVTARIIADACAGLDHAHRLVGQDGTHLNLVHRDMSPENLLITFEGSVKVLDFGIAKAADNSNLTQAGQIKGKLGYVAPETILGKKLDGRADIFAIGATLYLFLCGRPAFSGANPMEIFEKSLKPPAPPSSINNRVPPALEEICMRCLEQDRDKRYRSCGELQEALEGYLQGTGRPLGTPQLAQFMRILFPADKDPVRQRIDGMLKASAEREAAPAPLTPAPIPAPVLSDEPEDPVEYEDDDATHVAATMPLPPEPPPALRPPALPVPEERPEATAIVSADLTFSEPTEMGDPTQAQSGRTQEGMGGAYHLRSVELADQLEARKPPTVPNPPPSQPLAQAPRDVTIEIDQALLSLDGPPEPEPPPDPNFDVDLGISGDGPPVAGPPTLATARAPHSDYGPPTLKFEGPLSDASPAPTALGDDDERFDLPPPPTQAPEPAAAAPAQPPPPAPPAVPAPEVAPPPASAEAAGVVLSPVDRTDTDPAHRNHVPPPTRAVTPPPAGPPPGVGLGTRLVALALGCVVGSALVLGGLVALGELDGLTRRLGVASAPNR